MNISTITLKITSLYVAYAPEFDVSAYGACQDEALNNLTDELAHRRAGERGKLALNALGKNEAN